MIYYKYLLVTIYILVNKRFSASIDNEYLET